MLSVCVVLDIERVILIDCGPLPPGVYGVGSTTRICIEGAVTSMNRGSETVVSGSLTPFALRVTMYVPSLAGDPSSRLPSHPTLVTLNESPPVYTVSTTDDESAS